MTAEPRSAPRPKAARKMAGRQFQALDWALLRAPLLPIEEYLRICDDPQGATRKRLLADDTVMAALAVGSPDLVAALQRDEARMTNPAVGIKGVEIPMDRGSRTPANPREHSSLLRYLLRMSTRPTPFGMFAGVALSRWGARTDAWISGAPVTRSRPDMAWLLAVLDSAAAAPEIRSSLRVSANRLLVVRGGRVVLANTPAMHVGPTSIRATRPVLEALRMARQPIAYSELLSQLVTLTGASEENVEGLLDQLCRESILLTELRPNLTASDPAAAAAVLLHRIPSARRQAEAIDEIMAALSSWDKEPADRARGYLSIAARAREILPVEDPPLQTDMAWPVSGALSRAIAEDAANLAEILFRLSAAPAGPVQLQMYKRAFEARYGRQRRVPLLELLDPVMGLGSPGGNGHQTEAFAERIMRRDRLLSTMAISALRDRRLSIELSQTELEELQIWDLDPQNLPLSQDMSVFVLAASASDIDCGNFRLVPGPNFGAPAAGRNLGRFVSVLGHQALEALQHLAAAESRLQPNATLAEVVYLPGRPRSANVSIRPSVRGNEIVTSLLPDGAESRPIPVDELLVDLRGPRLRLTWERDGREIIPTAGHMLNTFGAPAVVAFLEELAHDGRAQASLFDWGPAGSLPVLPRVTHGNLVLRPAQWLLTLEALEREPHYSEKQAGLGEIGGRWLAGATGESLSAFERSDQFDGRLRAWASAWQVPRHVYLALADNRLLLDLEQESHINEIGRELRALPPGAALVLQEALPGPADAWLPGRGGHYLCELVIPLVRAAAEAVSTDSIDRSIGPVGALKPTPTTPATPLPRISARTRNRFPGSDWLYAKFYVPEDVEETFITGPLRQFAELATATGAAKDWFFIRYADEATHIRCRFRGDPADLTELLFPRLCAWAEEQREGNLCTSWSLDTYEREVDRYGGPDGVSVAEDIFCADSPACMSMLDIGRQADATQPPTTRPAVVLDRFTVAALSVDALLDSLGYDRHARIQWGRASVRDRRSSGDEYRRRGNALRSLLCERDSVAGLPGGPALLKALAVRQRLIAPVSSRLEQLEREGSLTVPLDSFVGSIVHLHCNRMLGRSANEDVLIGLLLRTWEGLERSQSGPARHATGRSNGSRRSNGQ